MCKVLEKQVRPLLIISRLHGMGKFESEIIQEVLFE
jgi:hypothetical protein